MVKRLAMTDAHERALLAVAQEAAEAAAAELKARSDRRGQGVHAKTGPTDLASDADLAAEAAIRRVLAERRPGDVVLGEEGGEQGGDGTDRDGALRWVVDPLDGTINYLFEIPVFAVSVACQDSSGTVAGVVLDPSHNECFTATRSAVGPSLNGHPIAASTRDELATALVATGFAYDVDWRRRQASVVARVLPAVRDIRRAGAAAIDLAWTACGRYDAFYERGLNAWDAAAGALVCERAGLVVRELPGNELDPPGIVAAPAGLIDGLIELISV
jgi:myo-inositol-1(or 4)-monophosphatase